jgi:hypothetical protein
MVADLRSVFTYTVFPLANLLTCITLVFLITRAGEVRKELRLLAFACMVILVWTLADLLAHVFPHPGFLSVLSGVLPLSLIIIPIMVQVTHAFNGLERRPLTLSAYALSFLSAGLMWPGMVSAVPGGVICAAAILAVVVYNMSCYRLFSRQSQEAILPSWLTAAGTTLPMLLLAVDLVPGISFPALSLTFIPLILISTGLALQSDRGGNASPSLQVLCYSFVINFLMIPVVSDLLFLLWNSGELFTRETTPWLFHHTFITALSFTTASFLALLSLRRSEKRIDALLYAAACILVCILNLRDIVITVLPEALSRQIIPVSDIFLVNLMGICTHLVLITTRKAYPLKVSLFYAAGFLLIPVILYESFMGGNLFSLGSLTQMGLGHFLFLAIFLIALCYCAWTLVRAFMSERERVRRRDLAVITAGVTTVLLILAGSILLMGSGLTLYPFYSISFVALIPIGYGIFSRELHKIDIYTRRKILSSGLRLVISICYTVFIMGIYGLLKDYPPAFILDRIVPYGIPPLLSLLCAGLLSLLVLGMEKNRTESMLFSLICFCYTVLNLDIFLLCVITSPDVCLLISRIDHFFLALLLLGVNLHLAFLVIGKRDQWWIVYGSYLAGMVMAPLTQTQYYFKGLYEYFWGYFAHKAVLYDVMSTLWGFAIFFSIYLLAKASRDADVQRRESIRRVLIAFIIIAVLSISNTPAIYGYEIYPLGTFVFIALIYLAYGLFKFNVGTALQYIRAAVFWTGLITIAVALGFIPVFLLPHQDIYVRLFAGLLLVSVLYYPSKASWDRVLSLFISKSSDVFRESIYRLTNDLSRVHHRDKIHQMFCAWFFEMMEGASFISLFSLSDLSGQRIYVGWKSLNPGAGPGCSAAAFSLKGSTRR